MLSHLLQLEGVLLLIHAKFLCDSFTFLAAALAFLLLALIFAFVNHVLNLSSLLFVSLLRCNLCSVLFLEVSLQELSAGRHLILSGLTFNSRNTLFDRSKLLFIFLLFLFTLKNSFCLGLGLLSDCLSSGPLHFLCLGLLSLLAAALGLFLLLDLSERYFAFLLGFCAFSFLFGRHSFRRFLGRLLFARDLAAELTFLSFLLTAWSFSKTSLAAAHFLGFFLSTTAAALALTFFGL